MPIANVLDSTMSYRETGAGVPLVFLHGNPTSSYLWRNVMPAVGAGVRRLAPDLIGMGESGKPDIAFKFDDHARYLEAWLDSLRLDQVVLVGHDWGGALAFDWAARHPDRIAGLAFTETILRPMAWEEFPQGGQELFRAIKTPGIGEAMMLDDNIFIEQALPGASARPLTAAELDVYRAPYPTPASRRPLLEWARSMPLGGDPSDVVERVEFYGKWLAASVQVPKLLMTFAPGPGVMVGPDLVSWCADNISGLEVQHSDLVAGHHTPEDQPEAIATAVADWLDRHGLRNQNQTR